MSVVNIYTYRGHLIAYLRVTQTAKFGTKDYDNKCQLICIGLTLKVVSRNKDNQNFLKCRIWCKNRVAMTR